ncbi:MAG TPA: hypothetical protein PLF78_02040, partial [Caulobacter sp.]|nr:hypothetical protein [Caulobacter sp.]
MTTQIPDAPGAIPARVGNYRWVVVALL